MVSLGCHIVCLHCYYRHTVFLWNVKTFVMLFRRGMQGPQLTVSINNPRATWVATSLLQRCDSSLLFTDLYNNMKILILTAKVAILCRSVARYYFEGHLQCKSRDKKIGWHSCNHNLRNTSFEPYQTAWSFYLTGP